MKNDEFGDRMKGYEFAETQRRFDLFKPIYARIDGRAFHTFTRGMDKPYDLVMADAMIETTKYLVKETNAKVGYTESDEISLVWLITRPDGLRNVTEPGMFFEGKIQKMCSVLAAMATAKFITELPPHLQFKLPHFDARVINLPTEEEAANMLLWRAMDGKKNAILAMGRHHFSHKELQGKNQTDIVEMLNAKGIDLDRYHPEFKYGTFVQKRLVTRLLTPDELAEIPEIARPKGPVIRSEYNVIPMPPFNQVKNRVGVIFRGEDPVTL